MQWKSEDALWHIWHRENYSAAKSITDPRNLLRDLFSKTCRATHGLE